MTSTAVLAAAPAATGSPPAQLGDFDALMRAEQQRVHRLLLALLHDADAADSLTQECFLKAYNHRNRFRGECSARTWLLRIAINLARDYAKSRRLQFWRQLCHRADPVEDLERTVDPGASPERILSAREQVAAVQTALESLPTQQRAVFVLRFFEDMSIEQIAAATVLRPGTVKAHLFRAVGAVRKYMKGQANS